MRYYVFAYKLTFLVRAPQLYKTTTNPGQLKNVIA